MRLYQLHLHFLHTLTIMITAMSFILGFNLLVHADTDSASGAGFTMHAELPTNQIDKTVSFFDLKVTPHTQQPLTVVVLNTTGHARKLLVSPVNAWTGDNGQVSYSPNKNRQPHSATTLTSLTSQPVTLNLAAHEGKPVTFVTHIPKRGITGQVLGAIYVSDPQTQQTAANKGFRINNRYAMALGVNLQQTATLKIAPQLRLNKVSTKLANHKPVVTANVENTAPILFGNMNVKGQIFHQHSSHPLIATRAKHYAMAPNTDFNYAIPLAHQRLKAGRYTAKITATSGKRVWHLQRSFTVTAAAARHVNKHVVIQHNWAWLYALIGVATAGLFAGTGYWFGKKRHQNQK